jgi:hypothetical protein
MKQSYAVLALLALVTGAMGRPLLAIGSSPTPTPTATANASTGPLNFQDACSFAVLGAAGLTNSGNTAITGDVGTYSDPSETGFGTVSVTGTNHGGDPIAAAAQGYVNTAFNDGMGRTDTGTLAPELGGTTVTAGTYNSSTTVFTITGAVTLDGGGDPNAVFIFQAGGTLTTAANSAVLLIGNAQAKNVFWVVGSSATLGGGADLQGSVVASASISLGTGATVTGRLMALTGQVTMLGNTITNNFGCPVLSPTPSSTPASGTQTVSASPTDAGTATPTPVVGTATASPTEAGTATPTPAGTATSSPTAGGSATTTPTPSTTPTNGPYAVSPAPVPLNGADGYAILAGSGITNTGNSSASGYLGSYPTASETGLGSMAMSCGDHGSDSFTQTAKNDLLTAYNLAAGAATTAMVGTELGGSTLPTGVYATAAGTLGLTGILTLDAGGNTNAVFIFKAASTLTTAVGSSVVLINGAQAKNVFWAIGSSATLGGNTAFVGTILAFQSITLVTGASIDGRLLAVNGAVTMDTVAINTAPVAASPCVVVGTPTPTPNGSLTASPSPTPGTATPTPTPTPSAGTGTPSATPNGTSTASPAASPTNTPVSSPTASPGATFTATPTRTTVIPAATATPGGPAVIGGAYFYPSPAKGSAGATVYYLSGPGNVTVKVYNQAGRLVDTIQESKAGGWQSSTVTVGGFANGVYYYVVKVSYAAGGTETQSAGKFVVLH